MKWIKSILAIALLVFAVPVLAQQNVTAVNVTSQGAVPNDGIRDDQAFQSAINTLQAQGGGSIFVPKGTYDFGKNITISSNIRIYGEGSASILKAVANCNLVYDVYTTSIVAPVDFYPMIAPDQTGSPQVGIIIENLTLDGNGANQPNGYSYCNFTTKNSEGMIVRNVTSINSAQNLNITNIAFTNFGWTDASKTLTDVGAASSFLNAAVGMRIKFTAGTGVDTTSTFYIASLVDANNVTLTADINGAGGNIANGINGANITSRSFCGFIYGDETGATSYNTVINSCYFDNAGYDCVRVGGKGAARCRITNCTILRGGQTSFQGYRAWELEINGTTIANRGSKSVNCSWTDSTRTITDLSGTGAFDELVVGDKLKFLAGTGVDTTNAYTVESVVSSSVITVTADINGGTGNVASGVVMYEFKVQGGVFLHAGHRCRIVNSTITTTNGSGGCVAIFGDAVLADNYAEDNVIDTCYIEYSGILSGSGGFDFNGASAGYAYARRNTISSCVISMNEGSYNHAGITYGTDTTGGGLTVTDTTITSISNEACINLGASRNILLNNVRAVNLYTGGFAAAKAMTINGSAASTPQGINITGGYYATSDDDVSTITITGTVNITINGAVIANLSTSVPSVPALVLDNADDTIVTNNQFLSGSSSTSGVISIVNAPDRVTVAYNEVRRGINNATQPIRGVGCTGGTYIYVVYNQLQLCSTSAFGSTFAPTTGSLVKCNSAAAGFTERNGTGTISSGVLVAAHGATAWRTLRAADVVIIPTNATGTGSVYVSSIDGTNINFAGTNSATFAWQLRANEN